MKKTHTHAHTQHTHTQIEIMLFHISDIGIMINKTVASTFIKNVTYIPAYR